MTAPKFTVNGKETTDVTVVQAALDAAAAAKPTPPPTMKVNGAETSDLTAVQAHIDGLEGFRKETLDNARKTFVENLATKNLILASQVDGLVAFALDLSSDQYDKWKATFENAVPLPALQSQAGGVTNSDGENPNAARDQEIKTLEDIVQNHRLGGLTDEQIKATDSYKKLQQLKSTQQA